MTIGEAGPKRFLSSQEADQTPSEETLKRWIKEQRAAAPLDPRPPMRILLAGSKAVSEAASIETVPADESEDTL